MRHPASGAESEGPDAASAEVVDLAPPAAPRPDSTRRRQLATELLALLPDIPTARVASATGLPEAVIEELRHGHAPAVVPVVDATSTIMRRLRNDPVVSRSEPGRNLLRWLTIPGFDRHRFEQARQVLPPQHLPGVARLARDRAQAWLAFAEMLEGGRPGYE
ncbi:hypothetical protein ACWDUL_37510 [Nocardia niigatensis]|uniref:hypothetical protein n=1 Tax=Nocardia niigatensis TaxID=209249 RepID=UPI0003040052|nr:hypothetical protein [Nocardia niigatensis]